MPENVPQLSVNPQEVQIEASSSFWDKLKIHKFKVVGGVLGALAFTGAVFAGYQLGQWWFPSVSVTKVTSTPSLPSPTPGLTEQVEVDCSILETLEMQELAEISQADCGECSGKWEPLSMDLNLTGCNPKTSDAGKTCTGEAQCLGVCLAQDESSVSGTCSEYKFILGCNFEFAEGQAAELCRD